MKIRTFTSIENGKYRVVKQTEDFSELENELMAEFGEPEIDLGGSFGDPAFVLTTWLERLKTGSPFAYKFDTRDLDLHQTAELAIKDDATALEGKYFDIDTAAGLEYRVWFDEDNASTPPAAEGRTLIEIELGLADPILAVAEALVAQLPILTTLNAELSTAPASGEEAVIVTDSQEGVTTAPDQGTLLTTELEVTVTVIGDSAQRRAEAWDTEITTRLTDAITTLRALTDTFSGERVDNV